MIKREDYPIEEAAKLANQSVEDLIHFGATGKLPLYLLLPLCYPKIIFEHNTAIGPDKAFRIIDPEGSEKSMYAVPVSGPQRITAYSLKQYELGVTPNPAGFDWNEAMELPASDIRRWYYPDPEVELTTARMVVKSTDMALLTTATADNNRLDGNAGGEPIMAREQFSDKGPIQRMEETSARQLEDAIKEQISIKAKNAANQRNAVKYGPIKARAIELYNERHWPSIRQAAKAIYPQVDPDHRILSIERGEQTVYEWLLAANKQSKT